MGRLTSRGAVAALTFCITAFTAFPTPYAIAGTPAEPDALTIAFRGAGLDDRTAARILVERFTFGARPGDIDRLLEQGHARWLHEQLQGQLPESALQRRLERFDTLRMSNAELAASFPSFSVVSAHARRFYPDTIPPRDQPVVDFSAISTKLDLFANTHGFRRQEQALLPQLYAQKVVRATYANNQLREVMTDFWQNHFFVSTSNFGSRPWVLSYERDALRPNALGNFAVLLQASAHHPALLDFYQRDAEPSTLDAASSTASQRAATIRQRGDGTIVDAANAEISRIDSETDLILERRFWPNSGPNLVFAQSLLSLQTLGPEAAVSADDLRTAARAFTGWTTMPVGADKRWFAEGIDQSRALGFERQGNFLFRADRHDAESKQLLGFALPTNGGVREGEYLLDRLSHHPATARHIARRLAEHFTGTQPPSALINTLAHAFRDSHGDIATVLTAMTASPDFWRTANRVELVKTPLEYSISALRAGDAEIVDATAIVNWIARMGQPLYGYQEPTGYPQRNDYWLDPASLLSRVTFAEQLTDGAIAGVSLASPPRDALAFAAPEFQLH